VDIEGRKSAPKNVFSGWGSNPQPLSSRTTI